MAVRWRIALLGAAMVACAPGSESDADPAGPSSESDEDPAAVRAAPTVVDLRDQEAPGWEGDTLIVDTRCLDLTDMAGWTLHEACDEHTGGRAHVGEDRIAATVFDDAACERAAGFLPPPGEGGDVRLPGAGLGVVLRCAVLAEPR